MNKNTKKRATRGRVMMWLGSDIDYGGLVDLITEFANSEYTNDEFYQDVMDYDIEDEEDTDERDLKWLTSPN